MPLPGHLHNKYGHISATISTSNNNSKTTLGISFAYDDQLLADIKEYVAGMC
jgi:hypothetical protein